MIFEKLADGITKHAKLVVIIWVLVLIASIYPAVHAGEHLSYSTSSMGSSNSESIEGSKILSEHFSTSSGTGGVEMQIIIVLYPASIDEATLNQVNSNIVAIAEGSSIIKYIVKAGDYTEGEQSGEMFSVAYTSGSATSDTGNLREAVAKAINTGAGAQASSFKTYVAGNPAISYDAGQAMKGDMARIDPLSILMILVLVGLFFRSFISSATPPLTIGVAFALVLCALFFLGQIFDIYYITEILLLVSMLGAGCDYCIFILSRYREERRLGKDHMEACHEAIMWAGESVTTSGIAVMIGFGAMMLCSFGLITYMGMGLAIGIVFALLAALTLMSSLLVLLGDKLFWPSGAVGPKLERGYLKKMGQVAETYFRKSTHFSIKHAKAIVAATLLVSVPMFYVYATSENSYDMMSTMLTGESKEGLDIVTQFIGGGTLMPNYAVVNLNEPVGTVETLDNTDQMLLKWTSDTVYFNSLKSDLRDFYDAMITVDNVQSVSFDIMGNSVPYTTTWASIGSLLRFAGTSADTDIEDAIDILEGAVIGFGLSEALAEALDEMKKNFTPEVRAAISAAGQNCYFGDELVCNIMDYCIYYKTGYLGVTMDEGSTTSGKIDYIKITMSTHDSAMSNKSIETVKVFRSHVEDFAKEHDYVEKTWITGTAAVMVEISDDVGAEFLKIEIVAIILIIILLFVVMKSYLTPIRSVVTIFLSVIWTVAITHLLFGDIMHVDVLWILPIILLVICLGLGMDYDILLTTRIKECHHAKGMDNDSAITEAVLHSGSVITICGLIMGGTFGTLMLSDTILLKQMGFALCFAILIDALVIRTYIVPACMHLMGEWNWKGPGYDPAAIAQRAKDNEKSDTTLSSIQE